MRCSVFIATSLDGYIARSDGGIDWLTAAGEPSEEEDYGFSAFYSTVDALVMGRGTFEKVLTFSERPYGDKRIIVMSRSWSELPAEAEEQVELFAGTPARLVEKLEEDGLKRLYIDGGKLIQSFLREGLITDMTITRIPILIGEGIPLFGELPQDVTLSHKETITFPNGMVQSVYLVDSQ